MKEVSREVGNPTAVILLDPLSLQSARMRLHTQETLLLLFLPQNQTTGDRLPSPMLLIWVVVLADAIRQCSSLLAASASANCIYMRSRRTNATTVWKCVMLVTLVVLIGAALFKHSLRASPPRRTSKGKHISIKERENWETKKLTKLPLSFCSWSS